MGDFDKDQVLQWYDWLEEQLLEIFRYIPPAGQNLATSSPRLASLIIESCGLLDSIFRQVSPDRTTIGGKNKARNDLDSVDYANLDAAQLTLPECKSILLLTPPTYRSPFSAWSELVSGGEYRPASWWRIHTDLKHDRIANLKKATLEVAVESLCALHFTISKRPEFGRAVLRRGWVPGVKFSPAATLEVLQAVDHTQSLSLLVEFKLFVVARI